MAAAAAFTARLPSHLPEEERIWRLRGEGDSRMEEEDEERDSERVLIVRFTRRTRALRSSSRRLEMNLPLPSDYHSANVPFFRAGSFLGSRRRRRRPRPRPSDRK